MIDVASPTCRSCVTVDARSSLCTGCTETDSGLAATQWACSNGRRLAAKMRRNTGPHSTVARSTLPRQTLSVSYRFMWLALLMSTNSRASLNTQQTGHSRERQHVRQTVSLNKGVTEPCHYLVFDHMFPRLTAELVCEYVTKECGKQGSFL